MSNWFHRWLNPHCPDCKLEQLDNSICQGCEILKEQLVRVSEENKELLNKIMELTTPKVERVEPVIAEEFKPKFVPWRVRREELEKTDRENARLLKIRQQEINANLMAGKNQNQEKLDVSDLEKEMGIIEQEKSNAS